MKKTSNSIWRSPHMVWIKKLESANRAKPSRAMVVRPARGGMPALCIWRGRHAAFQRAGVRKGRRTRGSVYDSGWVPRKTMIAPCERVDSHERARLAWDVHEGW